MKSRLKQPLALLLALAMALSLMCGSAGAANAALQSARIFWANAAAAFRSAASGFPLWSPLNSPRQ